GDCRETVQPECSYCDTQDSLLPDRPHHSRPAPRHVPDMSSEFKTGQRAFPSSPRRGGRDANKMTRSHISGADGVVGNLELRRYVGDGFTTPSARLRMLRDICLIAPPPLLGEEGKGKLPHPS